MAVRNRSYEHARSAFEYFSSTSEDAGVAFMENAGGSQVPRCVVDAVSEYLSHHYAQLGAGYGRSNRATKIVDNAHRWLEVFMNTESQGQVVVGPSTSQLAFNLASAFTDVLGPDDSIVLQEASHESVLGPWERLARRVGCEVRWWRVDSATGGSLLSGLEAALRPTTRLVVVTHVSNLVGEILDLAAVVRLVRARAPAAQVLADGVAYAPHRAIDVSAWGVDWYLWSAYKVYGPHVAVMYGRRQAFEALRRGGGVGPNHYFLPADDLTYTFELGGACHEGCAGLLALQDYLLHLLRVPGEGQPEGRYASGAAVSPQQQSRPHDLPVAGLRDSDPAGGRAGRSACTLHGPDVDGRGGQKGFGTSTPGQESPTQPPRPPPPPSPQQSDPALAGVPRPATQPAEDSPLDSYAAQPGCPRPGPHRAAPSPLLHEVHVSRSQVEAAFANMTAMEQPLQHQLLSYLSSHHAVRMLGSADPDPATRVPTISFVHRSKSSLQVARELQAAGFAVRCGSMYAQRLVEALAAEGGLLAAEAAARQGRGRLRPEAGATGEGSAAAFDPRRAVDEGVVRVSLLHYNTPEEVVRLTATMERVFA